MIQCQKCANLIAPTQINTGKFSSCPSCGRSFLGEVFPAVMEKAENNDRSQLLMEDGQSSCFYHPAKQAVSHCSSCGRFLCGLCHLEIDGKALCPQCLENRKNEGELDSLENKRTLYDSLAFLIAGISSFPVFAIYFSYFTTPFVFYLTIKHWNSPSAYMGRTKIRFIVACLLSTLQLVFIGFVIYGIFMLPD